MREGLLWFDDDPRRALEEKVRQAATRYLQKFGIAPDVCYVNAGAVEKAGARVGEVSVWPLATVAQYHLWIGREG